MQAEKLYGFGEQCVRHRPAVYRPDVLLRVACRWLCGASPFSSHWPTTCSSSSHAGPDCGRPAGRSGSLAPVAEGGRLSDRNREFSRGRAGQSFRGRIRPVADGSELCARYNVRRRGAGFAPERPEIGSRAPGGGDDGVGQRTSGGGSHASGRKGFRGEPGTIRSCSSHCSGKYAVRRRSGRSYARLSLRSTLCCPKVFRISPAATFRRPGRRRAALGAIIWIWSRSTRIDWDSAWATRPARAFPRR